MYDFKKALYKKTRVISIRFLSYAVFLANKQATVATKTAPTILT